MWINILENAEIKFYPNVKTNFENFQLLLQSGYIECEKDSCPAVDDCYVVKRSEGSCCDKCNSKYY